MARETRTLHIGGMSCVHCEERVRRALEALHGVYRAKVSYDRGTAEVTLNPALVTQARLDETLKAEGYCLKSGRERAGLAKTAGYLLLIAALYLALSASGLLNRLAPSQLAQSGMSYGMLFVVGLTTSVHCVAMCGGMNLSQSLGGREEGSALRAIGPALAYNAGRVISYTLTGIVMGALGMLFGAGLNTTLSEVLQGLLKLAAGVMMLAMGLNLLGLFPRLRRLRLHLPWRAPGRRGGAFVVGLLNGLMPCGPLQSMQLAALASASPVRGGLAMLAFSLGTVPLMLGVGSLAGLLGRRFQRAATRVGAVLVVVMGLAMLSQGAALAGLLPAGAQDVPENVAVVEDGVQVVRSTLRPGRYPDIEVMAGTPVRWVIDAPDGSINGCNNRILIPGLEIEYTFQPGENVIEFTPEEAGTLSYSCWMGMIRGSITVRAADGEG